MEKKTFNLNKQYLERVIAEQNKYVPKNRDEQLINHGLIKGYELLIQVIDEGVLLCKEDENSYAKGSNYFN